MNQEMYDDVALERFLKQKFGMAVDIDSVILRRADVSRTAEATVFLTKKRQLLAFVEASSPMTLADVKKIISRMGMRAELYLPPKGQPDYFDEIGRNKFLNVFPGRTKVSDEDIIFYRTLAPYNPALVMIAEVKNGEIYQYDADARSGWRLGAKFAYRRIPTS